MYTVVLYFVYYVYRDIDVCVCVCVCVCVFRQCIYHYCMYVCEHTCIIYVRKQVHTHCKPGERERLFEYYDNCWHKGSTLTVSCGLAEG